MRRELSIERKRFALREPFRIARGVKHGADVVTVELRQDGKTGRGECVPYARYGESTAGVAQTIEQLRDALAAGMGRDELQARLPPGAARNAVDTALWDLESQLCGVPVWERLAHASRVPLVTALTVGIDTPERMAGAAARLADAELIKVKVDAREPAVRIAAVRRAAPSARLIVDPNESWDAALLNDMQGSLAESRVALLEQPLPANADGALLGFACSVPVCADESCHSTPDLGRLRNRYQAVNIKLDKAGGLTEAWRMLRAARAEGFRIMAGCMVCSSLGIAPALEIACEAEFVDLDGPLWLTDDYPDGVRLRQGRLAPPSPGFWGG